jgi:LysM repeat protein
MKDMISKMDEIVGEKKIVNEANLNISMSGNNAQEVGDLFRVLQLGGVEQKDEPMDLPIKIEPAGDMDGPDMDMDKPKGMEVPPSPCAAKALPGPKSPVDDMKMKIMSMDQIENEDWANEPDEEYQSDEDVIMSGNDLHKEKGSYPATAGGDNPMSLEDRLKEELAELLKSKLSDVTLDEAPEERGVQSNGTLVNFNIDKSKPKTTWKKGSETKIIYATPEEIKLAQGGDLKGWTQEGAKPTQGGEIPKEFLTKDGNPDWTKIPKEITMGTIDGTGVERPPADPNALPPIKDGDEIPKEYLDAQGNPDWSKIPKEVTTGMIGGTGVERPPESTPQQSGGAAGEFGGTGSAPTPQQSGGKGGEFDTGAQTAAAPDNKNKNPMKPLPGSEYEIVSGDTLGAIAKKTGVSVDAIAKANGIADPNKIKVGQKLQIPAADQAAGANTASNADAGATGTQANQDAGQPQGAAGAQEEPGVVDQATDAVAGAWDDVKNWASNLFGGDDEAAKAATPEETKKSLQDKMAEIQAKLKELEAAEGNAQQQSGAF